MIFEPEPGTTLQLRDEVINFVALEPSGPASVFVYAEAGKEGTVYKVLKNSEYYALKVFYPEYRDQRLRENTEKLSRFRHFEGFRVAERTVLTQETYPDLIEKFPDLNFAVLMPWIEGTLWGNLIAQNDQVLQREEYFTIAQALIRSVRNLEYQGVAHCDLSNNNFIIDKTHTAIQLIDIEDMYAPDMPRPIPDVSYGTMGYRTKWIAQNGLWGPESDRFASAILCSEIITWHNDEIRSNKAGDSSYFDEDEIGTASERYQLMVKHLCDLDKELSILFDGAWFAGSLNDCPTAADWMGTIQRLGEPKAPVIVESEIQQLLREQDFPTLIHFKTRPDTDSIITPEVSEEPAPSTEIEIQALQSNQEEAIQENTSETPVTIDAEMESETVPESFENVTPHVEVETEIGETPQEIDLEASPTIPETVDATIISRGVPPRMEVNLEILDFGRLNKQGNSVQLLISNTGGAPLDGTMQPEEWLDVSPKEFHMMPGEQQSVSVTINSKFPRPKTGFEYRTANALMIESNIGSLVIGTRYNVVKPPIYESTGKRALIGGILGTIFGCLIMTLSSFNLLSIMAFPLIVILFGLAGGVAYPQISSIIFSLLGFVGVEMMVMLLLILDGELWSSAWALLGLGAVIGFIGGAIVSRILSGIFSSHRVR